MQSKITATFVALLLSAGIADAQSFSQLAPAAAIPGETIVIHGQNLSAATGIRFNATVGGFVGQLSIDVTPTILSDQLMTVVVPAFNAFAPPRATPPGEVSGNLQMLNASGPVQAIVFFFLEATDGQTTTFGQGGSEAGNFDPRSTFVIQNGLPVAGNGAFRSTRRRRCHGRHAVGRDRRQQPHAGHHQRPAGDALIW